MQFFYVKRQKDEKRILVASEATNGLELTNMKTDLNFETDMIIGDKDIIIRKDKKVMYIKVDENVYQMLYIANDIKLKELLLKHHISLVLLDKLSTGLCYSVNNKSLLNQSDIKNHITLYYQPNQENFELFIIKINNKYYSIIGSTYNCFRQYLYNIIKEQIQKEVDVFIEKNLCNHNIYEKENHALKDILKYQSIYSQNYIYDENEIDYYYKKMTREISYNNIKDGIINIKINNNTITYNLLTNQFDKELLPSVLKGDTNIFIMALQYKAKTCPEIVEKILDFMKLIKDWKSYTAIMQDGIQLKIKNINNFKLFYQYQNVVAVKYNRKKYKINEDIKQLALENQFA